MTNKETTKFYDAYNELEQIAKDMQDDPEKVIDVMEDKLKRAIELNKFCNGRLEKVQAMLDQYKADANVPVTDDIPVDAKESVVEKESSAEQVFDDDIPF